VNSGRKSRKYRFEIRQKAVVWLFFRACNLMIVGGIMQAAYSSISEFGMGKGD
jgi:hypothetical protein